MSTPATASQSRHLRGNCKALASVAPELIRRLALPCEDRQLWRDAEGQPTHYRLNGQQLDLRLEPTELQAALASAPESGALLVFGVGLGELVEGALRTRPGLSVTAWDRDPAMLLTMLERFDFRRELLDGRLRLSLGADLIDELEHAHVLRHPLLARVYFHEHELLGRALGRKRACVGTGRLFVDDLILALRAEGFDVLPIDFEGLALEEIEHGVARFDPELIATINYTSGLAEFCEQRGRELRVWEVDPTTDRLEAPATSSQRTRIHTYRKANVRAYRAAGFEHVEHMALASDTRRRRPLELSPEERAKYAAPVCFVGSSLCAQSRHLRQEFELLHARWHPRAERGERAFDEILALQALDPDHYQVPELARARFADFLDAVAHSALSVDPLILIAEAAAADRRHQAIARLAPFGVHVWGDDGWAGHAPEGVHFRGGAGNQRELTYVYNGGGIQVDIGRLYQLDIVTMRVFDVLACGGFLIAERSAELPELFEEGVELEAWGSFDELEDKVRHYLAHPEQAARIAQRGLSAVRERHSIQQRVRQMLGGTALAQA